MENVLILIGKAYSPANLADLGQGSVNCHLRSAAYFGNEQAHSTFYIFKWLGKQAKQEEYLMM